MFLWQDSQNKKCWNKTLHLYVPASYQELSMVTSQNAIGHTTVFTWIHVHCCQLNTQSQTQLMHNVYIFNSFICTLCDFDGVYL